MTDVQIRKQINTKIHDAVMNKYIKEKKANADRARAVRLEKYFNYITRYAHALKTGQVKKRGYFQSSAELRFIRELNQKGVPFMELFNYSLNPNQFSQDGFQFETDLIKIFNSIAPDLAQKIGGDKVYSNVNFLYQDIKNIPLRALDYMNEDLNKWIKYNYQHQIQFSADSIVRQAGVFGKIDLTIPKSTIALAYATTNEVREFLSLLQSSNITAKNYTNMNSIHLGSTKYFRVVSSIMEDIGMANSTPSILDVYYKTYRARINSKTKPQMYPHKVHMRFAYELLGAGQYYDINGQLQSLGTTDLLIVYNKSTQEIKVKSTYDIARQVLRKEHYSSGMGKSSSINLNNFD